MRIEVIKISLFPRKYRTGNFGTVRPPYARPTRMKLIDEMMRVVANHDERTTMKGISYAGPSVRAAWAGGPPLVQCAVELVSLCTILKLSRSTLTSYVSCNWSIISNAESNGSSPYPQVNLYCKLKVLFSID